MSHRGHERRTRPGPPGSFQEAKPRAPGRSARPPVQDPIARRWQEAAADLPTAHIVERAGVTAQMVYRCRHGHRPNLGFLLQFAAAFGFCLDWLLTGRGPRRPGEATRWALETAGPHDLCETLGALAEAGDGRALEALGDLFSRAARRSSVERRDAPRAGRP